MRSHIENSRENRVRANAVVVPIGADKTAVKADISCACARNKAKLGGKKIRFGDVVFFVQES